MTKSFGMTKKELNDYRLDAFEDGAPRSGTVLGCLADAVSSLRHCQLMTWKDSRKYHSIPWAEIDNAINSIIKEIGKVEDIIDEVDA